MTFVRFRDHKTTEAREHFPHQGVTNAWRKRVQSELLNSVKIPTTALTIAKTVMSSLLILQSLGTYKTKT